MVPCNREIFLHLIFSASYGELSFRGKRILFNKYFFHTSIGTHIKGLSFLQGLHRLKPHLGLKVFQMVQFLRQLILSHKIGPHIFSVTLLTWAFTPIPHGARLCSSALSTREESPGPAEGLQSVSVRNRRGGITCRWEPVAVLQTYFYNYFYRWKMQWWTRKKLVSKASEICSNSYLPPNINLTNFGVRSWHAVLSSLFKAGFVFKFSMGLSMPAKFLFWLWQFLLGILMTSQ